MRLIFAGGGTGGHLFPALAVAKELRRRDASHEILFVGTERGLEARSVPAAGFELRTIRAASLKGISPVRMLAHLLVRPRSLVEAFILLKKFRPQVVVGTGGYSAGPLVLVAALHGIPTLLIEPNSVPGLTNRLLAMWITRAAISFEGTRRYFGNKAVRTGSPVREEFFRVPPRARPCAPAVLVFGGSQGSVAINRAVMEALPLLRDRTPSTEFYHQTGERDYNDVREAYRRHGLTARVLSFIEDMPDIFAKIDLVIARSGAVTVAELAASGKASLLVPFPAATDHHQTENARDMERAGAARLIPQSELSGERLAAEISNLLTQPDRLAEMEARARSRARPEATRDIADLIEKLAATSSHP
ncbi:MAG: undecaprenyldiphospho-muramoylpentapeptide beta-N-acetylglucosaminyltransferase [Acidobacteriota bacterium]